jgi:hypothetical protein
VTETPPPEVTDEPEVTETPSPDDGGGEDGGEGPTPVPTPVPDDGGAGGGTSPDISVESFISTYNNPEAPPEGVAFIGPEFSCLPDLECDTYQAQYSFLDNTPNLSVELKEANDQLRAAGKLSENESLNWNDDYNACGQLAITAILHILGYDEVRAIGIFNQVAVNSAYETMFNFNDNGVLRPTLYNHLWPTAETYAGIEGTVLNTGSVNAPPDFDENDLPLDELDTLIRNAVERSNPILALVNIDDNGVLIKDKVRAVNHWVVVTGIGTAKGTSGVEDQTYVRIWNSYYNRAEYYEIGFFQDTIVGGGATLNAFAFENQQERSS